MIFLSYLFPESDERRVLVVYVFSRGRDVRPGRIRYASDSHPTYRFLSNCCRIAIEGRIRSIDFWGLATWADFWGLATWADFWGLAT